MARISVSDNGKGFPAEDRHRLTEPYVTTRAEGTGLGLPIVIKIFEDHLARLNCWMAWNLPIGGESRPSPDGFSV